MVNPTQVPMLTPIVEDQFGFSSQLAFFLAPCRCNDREVAVIIPGEIDADGNQLCQLGKVADGDESLGVLKTALRVAGYIFSLGILPLLAFILTVAIRECGTKYKYKVVVEPTYEEILQNYLTQPYSQLMSQWAFAEGMDRQAIEEAIRRQNAPQPQPAPVVPAPVIVPAPVATPPQPAPVVPVPAQPQGNLTYAAMLQGFLAMEIENLRALIPSSRVEEAAIAEAIETKSRPPAPEDQDAIEAAMIQSQLGKLVNMDEEQIREAYKAAMDSYDRTKAGVIVEAREINIDAIIARAKELGIELETSPEAVAIARSLPEFARIKDDFEELCREYTRQTAEMENDKKDPQVERARLANIHALEGYAKAHGKELVIVITPEAIPLPETEEEEEDTRLPFDGITPVTKKEVKQPTIEELAERRKKILAALDKRGVKPEDAPQPDAANKDEEWLNFMKKHHEESTNKPIELAELRAHLDALKTEMAAKTSPADNVD